MVRCVKGSYPDRSFNRWFIKWIIWFSMAYKFGCKYFINNYILSVMPMTTWQGRKISIRSTGAIVRAWNMYKESNFRAGGWILCIQSSMSIAHNRRIKLNEISVTAEAFNNQIKAVLCDLSFVHQFRFTTWHFFSLYHHFYQATIVLVTFRAAIFWVILIEHMFLEGNEHVRSIFYG